jgi:putative transcriptional regulator
MWRDVAVERTVAAPGGAPDGAGYTFVIRLDDLLEERGMSVAALSDATGLSVQNIHRIKRGDIAAFWLSTLGAICQALSVQPGDLLTYQD